MYKQLYFFLFQVITLIPKFENVHDGNVHFPPQFVRHYVIPIIMPRLEMEIHKQSSKVGLLFYYFLDISFDPPLTIVLSI